MTDENLVVWLDPGLITGIAAWHGATEKFWSKQVDESDMAAALARLKSGPYAVQLGYEQYNVTSGGPRGGTPKHSLGAIGLVRGLASAETFELLKPQPSSARILASPVLVRRMGWYRSGQPHANDATQHLLAHLLRQHPMSLYVRHKLWPLD